MLTSSAVSKVSGGITFLPELPIVEVSEAA